MALCCCVCCRKVSFIPRLMCARLLFFFLLQSPVEDVVFNGVEVFIQLQATNDSSLMLRYSLQLYSIYIR